MNQMLNDLWKLSEKELSHLLAEYRRFPNLFTREEKFAIEYFLAHF